MEDRIREAVREMLAKLGAPDAVFAVEWPASLAHGDFATNAAMAAAKALGRNPRELADELAQSLTDSLGEDASSVRAAGPGFVNITLSSSAVARTLMDAAGEGWGTSNKNSGTRVMVEYGNPNPFKEMHIGHMMGTIVGESIARLVEASGATLLRDTFGGDVGPHVAKALWSLRRNSVSDIANAKEIGHAYIQGSNAYEESADAKQEIDELNTKIYEIVAAQTAPETLSEEDRALLSLWRKGREVSMEEFMRIFGILGTHPDYIFYDSDTTEGGIRIVLDGLEKGIFEKSDGAIIYRGEKKGLHTLVFITSRGNPTYETKDIGLAFLKEERVETDEILIVTAVEQVGHFEIVLAALEDIAPELAKKTSHVAHGLLQLPTGKMSSRKGNVITAAELIADMIEKASERNEDPELAVQVAIGALKYMVLRQAAGQNVIFDAEKSLSLDGDSGPYLQYALVRAKAVLAKPVETKDDSAPESPYDIERLLIRFPEVVSRAANEHAPHHVVHYLTQLAGEWNSFYAANRIIGGEHEAYKLLLANAFVATMSKGLSLLGIPAPERM